MGRLLLSLACVCLVAGSAVVSAQGDKWPGRAAGASASGDPELLLTFDDGPHEKHTSKILDVLEERGLQAIFFWTGHRVQKKRRYLDKRLALVERAIAAGHLVGNHTLTHAKLCTVKRQQAAEEIDGNASLFEELTQMPMVLFRVPYGARCKRLDGMLADRELAHLHWDMDPQEFRHHSADLTLRYVVRKLRRLQDGQRAVLLMHDTQPAAAKALPKILEWIDEENSKRERRGRRPIRIISGSSWFAETQDLPLVKWGASALRVAQIRLRGAVAKLL